MISERPKLGIRNFEFAEVLVYPGWPRRFQGCGDVDLLQNFTLQKQINRDFTASGWVVQWLWRWLRYRRASALDMLHDWHIRGGFTLSYQWRRCSFMQQRV